MRFLAVLAAVCVSGFAAAAPFTVQVGETRVVLDAPTGFTDTTFTGSPRLQELGEALTSASNRILLFAISDADLRRFSQGDPPEFRRYMVVATARVMERERLGAREFRVMAEEALRDFRPPEAGADFSKYLEGQPIGAASALADLRRAPDVLSLLYGTRLPPTKIPRLFGAELRENFMLTTNTLLLVRGKALALSVFTLYDSAEDAAWLRTATERWIEDLKRLNQP